MDEYCGVPGTGSGCNSRQHDFQALGTQKAGGNEASTLLTFYQHRFAVAAFVYMFYQRHVIRNPVTQLGLQTLLSGRATVILRHLAQALGVEVIIEGGPIAPGTLLASTPHGIFPLGQLLAVLCAVERPVVLAARVLFSIPGLAEVALALGAVDASPEVSKLALQLKRNVFVVPGGMQEMVLSKNSKHMVVINNRNRGFIKLALDTRAPLRPCFSFGEWNIQRALKPSSRVASVIRRVFGIFPFCPEIPHWDVSDDRSFGKIRQGVTLVIGRFAPDSSSSQLIRWF